jgi:hypothetical protein
MSEWDDLELVRAIVHDLRHCGGKLANASDPQRKIAGRAAGEMAVLALNAADCISYLSVTILALGKERENYKAALLEELAPPPLRKPDYREPELSNEEAKAAIEAWAGPMPRFTATGGGRGR